jgi:DNA-binding response OmpR family regulator
MLGASARDPYVAFGDAVTLGLRVLVVDDNPDVARTCSLLLKLSGHDVRTAADGLSAVDEARAFHPDVAVLDIGLPGIDGFEVARRFRRELGFADTLIIAVSGYGPEMYPARSRVAAFDHHLTKPVDYDELLSLIA